MCHLRQTMGLAALALVVAVGACRAGEYLDAIAAVVNGEVITVFHVLRETKPVEETLARRYSGDELNEKIAEARRGVATRLIEDELVYAEYLARGYQLPAEFVERSLDRIVAGQAGGDWAKFEDSLQDQGTTVKEFRQRLTKRLAVDVLLSEMVRRPVQVSPGDIARYYQANREEFGGGERVNLQVIFLKRAGRTAPALAEAVAATRKRLAGGDDFGAVAKEVSEDVSAEKGGDLGWVEVATGRPELVAAVKGLSAGEVAEPVELAEGVYILRLVGAETTAPRGFDEALQAEVEGKLRRQRQQERYQDFIKKLREKFYVKTFFGTDRQ